MATDETTEKKLTAAEAAKALKCEAKDLLSWKNYGTHVVGVTRDGKKLSNVDAGNGAKG